MTDVLNLDYDPIFQPQYPATFANTSAQPNPASLYGLDLTGEHTIEVARPFQSASIFDIRNWSASLIAMTFQQFPQFPQFPQLYQLSDQEDLNSPQSHNNTSTSQKSSNEMTAATSDFTNQQFPDVDTSPQQTNILQSSLETPPFVEPSINYPCYPNSSSSNNTSTASNPVVLNNTTLDHSTVANNNYSPRNVYIGNYPQQQQQYLDHHNYHSCPSSHAPRVGMSNSQLSCLNQRIVYQNSSPISTSSVGRQYSKRISGSIGSNVSYPRPENVTSTSLPSSIATNLFTFNQSTNPSAMLVPSIYDHSSTIFTTKPASQTTITIPNSSGSNVSSPETTSPIKQSYSYSGPPKSYYSRLPLYDRPFKCDTCPQSFNRNHDLKRHKRIHLAVKPYPCPFCEKQFSRKDALKRHILVKGCNNNKRSTSPNNATNKNVDDSTNSSRQKYDSTIESESPIKSEPTSDNGVHYNI